MKTGKVSENKVGKSILKNTHNNDNKGAALNSSCAYLSQKECLTGAVPGDAIVITKWIGLYGSVMIAKNCYEELRSRYPAFIMDDAIRFERYLSVDAEAKIAYELGERCMYACGEGGLYAGLWNMTYTSGVGMSGYYKDIPIRQETVELCEFYDINPYKLRSEGSLIVVTSSPDELMKNYSDAGIPSSIIGYITEHKERILIYGDEKKHIQKPARDELCKVLW